MRFGSLSRYSSRYATLTALIAAAALVATPASAQSSFEIVPFIGSFVPLRDWGNLDEPSINAHDTFRQQLGILGGLKARLKMTDAVGVELAGSYVNSGWTEERVSTSGAGLTQQIAYTLHGYVLEGNARFTYQPRRSNLYGIAGLGYMMRGGRAWNDSLWSTVSEKPTVYNKSNLALIVGSGLRVAASPKLSTDITAELHIHNRGRVAQGFSFLGTTYSNGGVQSDLIVTVGIPVVIGGD